MYTAATPLLSVPNSNILLKLEGCNPSGSVRDRAAFSMISKSPKDKPLLVKDWGPFAVSAAWVAKLLGKRLTIVLSEDSPLIFHEMLSCHPCSVVKNITETGSCLLLDPLMDPEHPMSYCEGLAEELWQQCAGNITAIVCGTDTCATLMGCSTGLKIHDPNIMGVGAPISQDFPGNHDPLGSFDPEFYVPQLCDLLSYTSLEEAQRGQNWLKENLTIPCGIVGGAAFAAAQALERQIDGPIVVILPSRFDCW